MSAGVVYFGIATRRAGRLVKIGFTRSITRRVGQHTNNMFDFELLGHAPGCRSAERMLHDMFSGFRVEQEWFKPSGRLLSLAEYCRQAGQLPAPLIDAVEARRLAEEADKAASAAYRVAQECLQPFNSPRMKPENVVPAIAKKLALMESMQALASGWRPL